jgi:hypothetical protein
MVEIPAGAFPLRILLILAICLGGLLVHFCVESLTQAAQPFSVEWNEDGETDRATLDSVEEPFILPERFAVNILHCSIRVVCPESLVCASFAFQPLLPPPIASLSW